MDALHNAMSNAVPLPNRARAYLAHLPIAAIVTIILFCTLAVFLTMFAVWYKVMRKDGPELGDWK